MNPYRPQTVVVFIIDNKIVRNVSFAAFKSASQEHPVVQRQNPTSQLSVPLLHKPRFRKVCGSYVEELLGIFLFKPLFSGR
jgi:hypothetical protein